MRTSKVSRFKKTVAVLGATLLAAGLAFAAPAFAGNGPGSGNGHGGGGGADRVVVCKYVSQPVAGEVASHVVITDSHSLPNFDGTFPAYFSDAQNSSIAVRYAEPGEKAKDLTVADECPLYPGGTEDVVVGIAAPYAAEPSCEVDGALVIPEQEPGVEVTQDPVGTGPGTYDITFATADGYVFEAGAVTEYNIVVEEVIPTQSTDSSALCYEEPDDGDDGDDGETDDDQVAGVEKTAKKPKAAPKAAAAVEVEVLGVEAEAPTPLPTAVSAGLVEAPADSPLGSGMVAGGLGLLALAGIMAKRRPVLDESRR